MCCTPLVVKKYGRVGAVYWHLGAWSPVKLEYSTKILKYGDIRSIEAKLVKKKKKNIIIGPDRDVDP